MGPPTHSRAVVATVLLIRTLAAAAASLMTPGLLAAERTLLDFRPGADEPRIETSDAKATVLAGPNVRVVRVEAGHAERWPGVTLKPASGTWDLSPFGWLVLPVRNAGAQPVTVHSRVDNAGADGVRNCVTGSVQVPPGEGRSLRVELKRSSGSTLEGRLFGMRGYPVASGGDQTIDPGRVTQILVFVGEPKADHVFEIGAPRLEGDYVTPTASVADAVPYFPLIDSFGQYRHRDWPGKTHGAPGLARQREAEEAELQARPGPADWSRYGGWAGGPRLRASGFFRVEKHAGKWWLVDPDGCLFFSHGVDCVRMQEFTAVCEREAWFEGFPGDQPEFAGFFLERGSVLKGHFAGKAPRCFSFAGANLFRKYGADWRTQSAAMVHRRLRSWGMNTIGMWSDESTRRLRRTPYVDAIGSQSARRIEGSEGYWGKFPDPFDPSFRATLEKGMASKRGTSAGDPWCLGFFCDNELAWGDETSLALAALRSPADQAAKRVFIDEWDPLESTCRHASLSIL